RLVKEMELLVDGVVQPGFPPRREIFAPASDEVQLQLAEGDHAIKVQWHGKKVWAGEVKVKPSEQGVTVVKVPALDDPEAPGTLVLKFVGPDADRKKKLELFIDGNEQADGFAEGPRPPGGPSAGGNAFLPRWANPG